MKLASLLVAANGLLISISAMQIIFCLIERLCFYWTNRLSVPIETQQVRYGARSNS